MPKIIKNGKVIGSSPSALSGLQDTDIQTPTAGQVLAYDGSKWANEAPASTAKVEVISLSFTSSNDGLYLVPTNDIPLTKYPVFAYEDTELANYYFTINNYRNTNWLVWCRNAQDLSLATNKAFTVSFVCVSNG